MRSLLLFLVICAAYIPSLECGYIWDDDAYVLKAQEYKSISDLKGVWTDPKSNPQYYPLVYTSYWLESQLWQDNPMGYHLSNIFLHALSAILIWKIVAFLGLPGAWICGLFFGLHPVHVESVSWITERKNVLSGIFYLASLMLYLRWAFEKPQRSVINRVYFLSLICFLLALFSKTVTCSLPAALLLILWWKKGRIDKVNIFSLTPYFILGFLISRITVWIEQFHSGAIGKEWDFSFIERCLIASRAVFFYISKLIWPDPLVFIYPRWNIDETQWPQYFFLVAIILLVTWLWKSRDKMGRGPLVALLFFIGTLFPALGFINVYPMRFSFVADHFQYLASISIIVLIVSCFFYIFKNYKNAVHLRNFIFIALTLIYFSTTWTQQEQYLNEKTLWEKTIEKNPGSWLAYDNLGVILERENQLDLAIKHYKKAISIYSEDINTLNNMGNALILKNQPKEARIYIERALKLAKEEYQLISNVGVQSLKTYKLLGDCLRLERKYEEAVKVYQYVLKIMPNHLGASNQLGAMMMMQKKWDEALNYFNNILVNHPNQIDILNNVGAAHQKKGNYSKAIEFYRRSLSLNQNYPATHYNLAGVLKEMGDTKGALRHYKIVIELNPKSSLAEQATRKFNEISE